MSKHISKKKSNIFASLFLLAGLVATVFLLIQTCNLRIFSSAKKYSIIAKFNDVGNLSKGSLVKSSGVKVGYVSNIDLDNQNYQAIVMMNLDEKYTFPLDSTISILTSGLLGNQYLSISAGSREEKIKHGGIVEYTHSAIVLENTIGRFLYNLNKNK